MPFVIALANAKGGCGKTTLTMLLAGALAKHLNVIVADSDPQGTASLWSQVGAFPCKVVPVDGQAEIDRLSQEHDAVLVDCPPNVNSSVMEAALRCAHLVLVPCAPEPADVWATTLLLEKCRREHPNLRLRVVLNKVPTGTVLARDTLATIQDAQWPLAKSRIGLRTAYKEVMALGSTLDGLKGSASSKAREEIQELSLEALTALASS